MKIAHDQLIRNCQRCPYCEIRTEVDVENIYLIAVCTKMIKSIDHFCWSIPFGWSLFKILNCDPWSIELNIMPKNYESNLQMTTTSPSLTYLNSMQQITIDGRKVLGKTKIFPDFCCLPEEELDMYGVFNHAAV